MSPEWQDIKLAKNDRGDNWIMENVFLYGYRQVLRKKSYRGQKFALIK